MSEEKTHQPTPRKLEKARKEGKVLKSQLITQTAAFIAGILIIREIFKNDLLDNRIMLEYFLTAGFRTPELCLQLAGRYVFRLVVVFLALCAACSVLAEVLQVGFRFEPSLLAPKMKRLSPANLLNKLKQSPGQLAQLLVRGLAVSFVFYWLFQDVLSKLPALLLSTLDQRLSFFSSSFARFCSLAFAVMTVAAGVDYLVQRRRFNKEMMMSHTELKNEFKNQEGDPLHKSYRRSMHEELLRQNMIARVRKAKVVVVDR